MQLITPAMMLQVLGYTLLISLPFIALVIVKEVGRTFLTNLLGAKSDKRKDTQKQHEKQLKKMDKVYGTYSISKVDKMTGQEFELFVEKLFRVLEKDKILKTEFTPATGDQGCDLIIHYRDGHRLGIQCKRYASTVNNKAVQNIVSSKAIYRLTLMMVFTNNHYTPGAKEAARSNRVELVDRDSLIRMIDRYNETLRALHAKD